MARSHKKLHLTGLSAITLCVVIIAGSVYLLLTDPATTLSRAQFIHLGAVVGALCGILITGALLYRSTEAMRRDIRSLVSMFKDVRQGTVRAAYPVEFAEFAAAQRYLRGWGEEMLAEREQLKDMGLIDHLSQLSNRRHFDIRLKEIFDNARSHGPSSVLILDADQFKQVNDNHGHDAGDALIVKFAALLRANVRHSDILARMGGDEFCIIYTYVPLAKASALAERLRHALPREIELTPGVHHPLRWSAGLSVFDDADTKPEDVLKRADQALLRAKEAGRNRTIVHDGKAGPPGTPPILAG